MRYKMVDKKWSDTISNVFPALDEDGVPFLDLFSWPTGGPFGIFYVPSSYYYVIEIA